MLNLLIALKVNQMTPLFIGTIVGLCIVPIIIMWVSHFFMHLSTMLTSVTLGPHIQGLIGGIGSLIHEVIQIIMAFLTGHNIKYVHLLTIQDFRNGHRLGDVDHNWQSNKSIQSLGDFLLGVIPFYIMSYVIILWQKMLSGVNPFTPAIAHMNVDNYKGIDDCIGMVFSEFHSAFSGLNIFTLIIFIIGLFILGLYGLNTSVNECEYVTRGAIAWFCIIIILDIAVFMCGLSGIGINIATIMLNFSFFIMARTIVYAIVFMIPIGILKVYSKIKSR